MSRLLALSWALPPLLSPRALQVGRILKSLGSLGWRTTAVSVNPSSLGRGFPADSTLDGLPSRGCRVVRVDSPLSRRLLARLAGPGSWAGPLPDLERGWARRAVREANRLLAQGSYSALLTFAQPWSDHLAGLELSQRTGLPWVAHFSDPWADNPYYSFSSRRQKQVLRMEKEVVGRAQGLVFTSQRTARLVMAKYPSDWAKKVAVIPHGFDPEELIGVGEGEKDAGRLRLVQVGHFYGPRTPDPLIRALGLVNQDRPLDDLLEVILVGRVEGLGGHLRNVEKLGLAKVVSFLGPRPFKESLGIAAWAEALLLIDAALAESVFLPSKLVDYLPLSKPILGLTPAQGESADLLNRLGCPVAPPDDPPAIAEALTQPLDSWQAGKLKVSSRFREVAAEYEIKKTSATLARVLDLAVDRTAPDETS